MFWTNKSPQKFMSKSVLDALDASFSEHELVELAKVATLVEVEAGTKLTVEGTLGQQALILVTGTASVIRDGEKLATLKAGDIIGEMALLSGEPRTATVTVDSDASVYAMSQRDFSSLLTACPRLAKSYTSLALRRLTSVA